MLLYFRRTARWVRGNKESAIVLGTCCVICILSIIGMFVVNALGHSALRKRGCSTTGRTQLVMAYLNPKSGMPVYVDQEEYICPDGSHHWL